MGMRYMQWLVCDLQSDLPMSAPEGQPAYCLDVGISFIMTKGIWSSAARLVVKHSAVAINGKTAAATKIYTLEASPLAFYPALIVPRVVKVGGVVTPPSMSIGTISPNYSDISTASLLNSLLATLGVGSGAPSPASASPALAGGTDIYAKVGTGAVATDYTVSIDVIGYYQ